MFDPDVDLDSRLAAEFGIKPGDVPFYSKADCHEEELKYLTQSFQEIRSAIHRSNSRIVDARAWTANPYALVTLNLDTIDRQLAQAGYSMRVRFAYDGDNKSVPISKIDMSIKTALPMGSNVVMFKQKRGEWEAELHTLKPSLAAMIEANKKSKPPLPDFFKDGHLKDDDFFVESVGCTLRNIYPSYEKFTRHGKTLVTSFQHTEDILNVFMTPQAEAVTGQDSEAEAEFLGIYNLTEDDASPEDFDKLMDKSKKLLDRVIMSAAGNIQRTLISKAVRARNGLETVYGPSSTEDNLSEKFGMAQRVDEAARYALMYRIKPENAPFEHVWHLVARMKVQATRLLAPVDDTFHPAKYMR
jgi:hypothetical protein